MDVSILTQADFTLNKCGRPAPPRQGLSSLYITKGFLIQVVFPAAISTPTQTITKEIIGETTWCLRSLQITSSAATAMQLQVLLPDGKFLISNLQDALQIAGYGSYRYCFTEEKRCPPGSKIQVQFNVTDTTLQQPMAILFDGAYQFTLKGGEGRICPVDETVANLPRLIGGPNQNIMAPPWQHGVSTPTPAGFEDEDFTYAALQSANDTYPQGAPGSTISVTAANLTATQQIGTDNAEFHCLRILVEVSCDDTVTGAAVLARIRTGSGYALMDDPIDAAQYVGSSFFPIDFVLPPNEIVYADLTLVDQSGTGNVYWTMYLDGFKRRRK